ncbi:peptidoglycan-binding domain-containing protein [Iningainema tapete]|uniref:Peptidoglycan-binding protein n=1 Tax=Iningainema tapete BLCC-T55 TaxID=2748662 RepID=A0A8J6XPW2_9CYAN|nr:peptidoglycan-binding protein [Iningainema tapete]MBD2775984.1 peptidoglycan-binding protein [Iningainema tapete BLCC-T55]
MKRAIELVNILLGAKNPKLYFSGEKQVYLFTKRPILHRDFTPKSLEDAIHELQAILHSLNFLSNPSGKFDLETESAVKEFQKQHNLYVDGIVGPLTWACLCYPKLSLRDSSLSPKLQDAVNELQKILHKEGILKKDPDGYFDKQTERAVKYFQRIYGLKDDGIVGAATWAVLLGMRQKREKSFPKILYFLPVQSLFLWKQLLMIVCILLGIYHSPLPGSPPQLNTAIATAYGLTCVVPFLLQRLQVLQSNQPRVLLFEYAPYVLTGIFWKPVLYFLLKLIK